MEKTTYVMFHYCITIHSSVYVQCTNTLPISSQIAEFLVTLIFIKPALKTRILTFNEEILGFVIKLYQNDLVLITSAI